jgi:hypothetical protein
MKQKSQEISFSLNVWSSLDQGWNLQGLRQSIPMTLLGLIWVGQAERGKKTQRSQGTGAAPYWVHFAKHLAL